MNFNDQRTPEDVSRLYNAIQAMVATLGGEADQAMLAGYRLGLRGIPIEQIERAVAESLQTCDRRPSPRELRELAGETCAADRAVLAFTALERAVGGVGSYRSPDFDDPLINATVRTLGGWERICGLSCEEFGVWFRKDFLKEYETLSRTGVNGELTAPLVGVCERENRGLGYDRGQDSCQVETGLPWAGEQPKGLERRKGNGVPRLELKKP